MEAALAVLLDARETITSDRVKAVAGNATLPAASALEPGKVDLTTYDQLLGKVGT